VAREFTTRSCLLAWARDVVVVWTGDGRLCSSRNAVLFRFPPMTLRHVLPVGANALGLPTTLLWN
jgi:hypothetical protein